MENKENVYENIPQTEQVAVAKLQRDGDLKRGMEDGSTVLGKFKSVDALMNAYGSLQAEFTRRSQRLKELENVVENFQKQKPNIDGSGVEKLRKNAAVRRQKAKSFEAFLAEVEQRKKFGDDFATAEGKPTAQEIAVSSIGESSEGGFEQALRSENASNAETAFNGEMQVLTPVQNAEEIVSDAETEAVKTDESEKVMREQAVEAENIANGNVAIENVANGDVANENAADEKGNAFGVAPVAEKEKPEMLSSEALYERVRADENVRLRIIGEYLASVGKTGAPLTVGGVGTVVAPPLKPRSIGEAGNIALRYFKNVKGE
ncbi:MAG: hypothetical protein IJX87_06695 [Clostridia bacterium]|nr:hypothetical protein [Clostridia bacterium]